ncbi:MAG: IS5 family transposase [Planctomycetia bacterium]|nr:IS5 family transposase [Planctomycetia bacterium]
MVAGGSCGIKIHLVRDANGNYINAVLSAGQEYEMQHFEAVVASISVSSRRGPSKRRPRRICGDKGYSSETVRQISRSHNITPVIPRRCNEKKAKLPFDRERYQLRNIIERIIAKIKELRRIATRYEKLSLHYLAMIKIAFIKIWLKKYKKYLKHSA